MDNVSYSFDPNTENLMDATFSILSLDQHDIDLTACRDIHELLARVRPDRTSWITLSSIALERDHLAVRMLLDAFQLNSRLLDNIFGHDPQPLDDEDEDCLYMDYSILLYRPQTRAHTKIMGSFILGKSFLIQLEKVPSGLFERTQKRVLGRHTNAQIYGADYLLYLALKTIIINYQDILKSLTEKFERLEDDVIGHPGNEVAYDRILELREEFKPLNNVLLELTELINRLREEESHHLTREVKKRIGKELLRETAELMASYQDLRSWVAELIEIHRANVNESTNRVIKTLTILSSIFLPLTFIVGVYGMNFSHMPELDWEWGYPVVLVGMLGLAVGALIFMRKKNWI